MKITFGMKLTALVLILAGIVLINQDKPILILPYSILLTYVLFKYGSYYLGAPWFPTPMHVARKMVSSVAVRNKIIYDLGSGDGRIVILAAERGARAYGVEADFFRWAYSLIRIKHAKVRARVFFGNFFWVSLRDADVVFMYLMQETVDRLQEKFLKEMKPGAYVVTHIYRCRKLRLIKHYKKEKIYVYRVPRRGKK